MTKFLSIFIICLSTLICDAQTLESIREKEKLFYQQKNTEQKNSTALDIIEEYTYLSKMDKAQNWVYRLIEYNYDNENDTLQYYIKTNQTEIFYWLNLFEFAEQPAYEALKIAEKLKDSTLISNASMFVSYIKESQDSLEASISYAHYASIYFPKITKDGYRVMIKKSQIINNLAQIYVKLKMIDSALFYNRLAYPMAIEEKSERALIYCDYNNANIFLQLNNKDSALYYFDKSNRKAEGFKKFDLLLQNYTSILDVFINNRLEQNKILNKCLKIIDTNDIAPLNKKVFYDKAIIYFKENKNEKALIKLQANYIQLQAEIAQQGNVAIQKVSQKFVENENHFLQLKIEELNNKRKLNNLLASSIIIMLLLGLVAYFFYTKKRKIELESKLKQQQIIAHERYRIANDIHDDLGTNLSRIRYITSGLHTLQTDTDLHKNYSKIISLSDDSVDKMNEIIWSLKQEDFTIDELFSYIRKMSSEISEEKNIEISYSFIDNLDAHLINAETCRNLYLTVKEALHNSIKHAKASQIIINTSFDNKLIFKVIDNGIGFELNQNKGNGIANMKNRMLSIKGDVNIVTNNEGTIVTIISDNL